MTGQLIFKFSADVAVERADRDVVGPETLNSFENASLPRHTLCLKVGCSVMCLRNLDPVNGLQWDTSPSQSHGNPLSSLHYHRRQTSRKGTLASVDSTTISLQSPDNDAWCPFSFRRIQFPVGLAFAMTINKSQGQTSGDSTAGIAPCAAVNRLFCGPSPGVTGARWKGK